LVFSRLKERVIGGQIGEIAGSLGGDAKAGAAGTTGASGYGKRELGRSKREIVG